MATYNLSLSAKWSPAVGRSQYDAGNEVDIAELYPDEMEENTDGECPLLDVVQEIFPTLVVEDTETGDVQEITLNPFGDNPESISYTDGGEFFDESDLSDVSWLYCCKVGDKVNWSCVMEIEGSFDASKLTASYKRFTDGDGDPNFLLIPIMTYDGQELCFDCEGGEGTDGEFAWILSAEGREQIEQ